MCHRFLFIPYNSHIRQVRLGKKIGKEAQHTHTHNPFTYIGTGIGTQLPLVECNTDVAKHSSEVAIPVLHNYYQPGDVTIGGIVFQTVNNHPTQGDGETEK